MFRDVIVAASPIGSRALPSKGSTLFLQYKALIPFYRVSLQSNQTAVAYSQYGSDTIAPLEISCNAGHCTLYALDRNY